MTRPNRSAPVGRTEAWHTSCVPARLARSDKRIRAVPFRAVCAGSIGLAHASTRGACGGPS